MVAKLTLKDAVNCAKSYVAELYQGEQVTDLMLEEIRLSSDEGVWHVTIGFTPPWVLRGLNSKFSVRPHDRVYKVVNVDSGTGEVRAIEIRTPGSDPAR